MKPVPDQRVTKVENDVTFYTSYQGADGIWYEGPDVYAKTLPGAEAAVEIMRNTLKISGRGD